MVKRTDNGRTSAAVAAVACVAALLAGTLAPAVSAPTAGFGALGATELVSVSTDGRQGRRWSGWNGAWIEYTSVSANGRYVAFASGAPNLVPGDTNDRPDIFVRDTVRDVTSRVSVSSSGVQGNRRSYNPTISADGRYIAFSSRADNLAPADSNFRWDAFVHDRARSTTRLVSIRSDGLQFTRDGGSAWASSISGDGGRVVFNSSEPGGAGDDRRGRNDVFVRYVKEQKTAQVSRRQPGVAGFAGASEGRISGNGRYVVFTSVARNLLPAELPVLGDLYVRDLRTGTISTASAGWGGTPESRHSSTGSLSWDGSYLTFSSLSRNLLENQSPWAYWVIYVRNLRTGQTWWLAPSTDRPTISADGNVTALATDNQLEVEDTDDETDGYVWDRRTQAFARVNLQPDGSQSAGDPNNQGVRSPTVTADGTGVVFLSGATDLVAVDTNRKIDVFLSRVP